MSNVPVPPTFADPVVEDPITKKSHFNPIWIKWFLDFAQILQTLPGTTNHEGLAGLLGGTANEHYHFTNAEHAVLSSEVASTLLGRGSAAGAGTPQAITLGSGLSMGGTALSVVAGTNGVGYVVGAGGTVAQATSKSTPVTLNKLAGEITMNGAALAAGTSITFVLSNSTIAATDIVVINQVAGGTSGAYIFNSVCTAAAVTITLRNVTAGALSEALVLRFAVIKAATT